MCLQLLFGNGPRKQSLNVRAIYLLLSMSCSPVILRVSPARYTHTSLRSGLGHKSRARLSHTHSLTTYGQSTFSVFSSVYWLELRMSRGRAEVGMDLGRIYCQLNTQLGTRYDISYLENI